MPVLLQIRIKDSQLRKLTDLAEAAGVGLRPLAEGIVSAYLQDPGGSRERRLVDAVLAAVRAYETGTPGKKRWGRPSKLTDEQWEEAAEMRRSGMRFKLIAAEFPGADHNTIRLGLKRRGLA